MVLGLRASSQEIRYAILEKDSSGGIIFINRTSENRKYQPFVPRKIRRIISKAIALAPADRYQTALDMRRALEQLLLTGYCTSDASGNVIICCNSGYSYRYEIHPITTKTSNFVVYKKLNKTGRETRATKCCMQNVKNSDIPKRIFALSNDLL